MKTPHSSSEREIRRRLVGQARLAEAVSHARVLAPVMVDSNRRRPSTVWPWIAGRDLAGRVTRHGRPDTAWARAIADELDDIVAAIHDRGLVHGALTADHVLLDLEGRPVLIGLDPKARPGPVTRQRDRSAVAAIHELLLGRPAASRRASPTLAGSDRRPRRSRWPLAAGLALTLIGATVGLLRSGPDSTCPTSAGGNARWVDVDGDGCEERLEWSDSTAVLSVRTADGPRAWSLGQPGDRLLLGDWDCDGTVTPGLHRPSTGRTYGFDRWPTGDGVHATLVDPAPACE